MVNSYCRNYARVAWSSPHPTTGVRFFTRLRCKQWHCEHCATINAKMWQAHLLDNINRLSHETMRWSFVTITSPSHIREPHASYHAVNKAWRKLTNFWRSYHRDYGGLSLIYARTLEAHQSGAVHAHAIIGHDLPLSGMVVTRYQRTDGTRPNNIPKTRSVFDKPSLQKIGRLTLRFRDLCVWSGAGYIADIQPIYRANAGLVVAYITKYITKENQTALDLPKHARRIVTSQDFTQFGYVEDSDALSWEVSDTMYWEDYLRVQRDASALRDMQKNENITLDKFEDGTRYPPISDRLE